ncbi:branched-chain amino acid transport system II carrier protein [Corynebacterium sp. UMB9976]|uniref:Branched-chain amino acid transport system II carrier protein n=1 Tax=Corynebacterium urealyticum TaxID=43771 RepID=A0A5D4FYV4_9CORY|nr:MULTISPECIES: branched-chain amino acid transport system II carrier protein [Corynebacterium]MDK6301945.1 branched-chain amino acid transport system II carrier protein [Corynebacterium sp. UMB9976]TYR20922.1 branched-chain amino acid transport system II carrier protein [Corynebacterium urealyticum]
MSSGTSTQSAAGRGTAKPAASIFAVGLMLFSMFFGAGNLIFPPMLGIESGENFTPAIIGFILTGVLLPTITIIAVAISGAGVRQLASRAGAAFGLVFSIAAYLSIGSFYAMPRAAAIGYELGIESTFGLSGQAWRLVTTAIFFTVAFAIVLFPGKVADTLGNFLTPLLLALIAILAVLGFMKLNGEPAAATGEYASSPLTAGILEGYFTMDSIAAMAFAIIVVSSFNAHGVKERKTVVKYSSIAAVLAGFFLLIVYLALGVMGTKMPDKGQYSDGAAVLSQASKLSLGTAGDMVFSGVVLLACLTTAVGLIAASASFFHELVPAISYRWWSVVFTLIGFTVANLGLEKILSFSGPIIGLIYPPAIALIAVTFTQLAVRGRPIPLTYRAAVAVALVFSIIDLLSDLLGEAMDGITGALSVIPLYPEGLGWVLPTIVVGAIALVVDLSRKDSGHEADALAVAEAE